MLTVHHYLPRNRYLVTFKGTNRQQKVGLFSCLRRKKSGNRGSVLRLLIFNRFFVWSIFYSVTPSTYKTVKYTLKILEYLPQNIKRLFVHFVNKAVIRLLMESNYFTKCADDTTSHNIGNNVEELVSKSKAATEKPFARFC